MPPAEYSDLIHTVVIYPFMGRDRYGTEIYGEPYQIDGRIDNDEGDLTQPDGTKIRYQGSLRTYDSLKLFSLAIQGELEDWLGTGSSEVLEPLISSIIHYDEIDDIKGRDSTKTARLMRYKGAVP